MSTRSSIQRRYAWTSDASGDATIVTQMRGAVVRVVTVPDDTDVPSANYDVSLVDEDGVDVLAGECADRSATDAEQVFLTDTPFVDGELTVTVANAGNAKSGTVVLYVAWG